MSRGDETNDAVARDMLRGFVGEIEASDDRIASENKHKSAIYKRAKDKGFNVKALRKVIAARRMDEIDRSKLEGDFDLYWMAVSNLAHAHVEIIEDFDPETGEILDTNTARETLASTTAADPAGEADDASSADQSTAALTEVPGTAPDHQDLRDIADAPRSYPPEPQQKAAEHASSGSVAGAPAGTQAPPVDTNSEPQGASIGAKPSMASEPATGEGSPQPSSVVPGRQPGCLNPDTCAGTWRKRCASCERAFMAVAAGGQVIVHQGAVG